MNEPPAARYHRSNPLNNSPLRCSPHGHATSQVMTQNAVVRVRQCSGKTPVLLTCLVIECSAGAWSPRKSPLGSQGAD